MIKTDLFYRDKINLPFSVDNLIDKIYKNLMIRTTVRNDNPEYPGIQCHIILKGKEIDYVLKSAVEACKKVFFNRSENLDDVDYVIYPWVFISRDETTATGFHHHLKFSPKLSADFNIKNNLTFTYYVQMPNNLSGDEGKLSFLSNNTISSVLPDQFDLFVFGADVLHRPELANKTTKDRIVICGNVSFEFDKVKSEKSVI